MDARRRFYVMLALFGIWVIALGIMAVTTAVKPREAGVVPAAAK